jgi:hypothetical protein
MQIISRFIGEYVQYEGKPPQHYLVNIESPGVLARHKLYCSSQS